MTRYRRNDFLYQPNQLTALNASGLRCICVSVWYLFNCCNALLLFTSLLMCTTSTIDFKVDKAIGFCVFLWLSAVWQPNKWRDTDVARARFASLLAQVRAQVSILCTVLNIRHSRYKRTQTTITIIAKTVTMS